MRTNKEKNMDNEKRNQLMRLINESLKPVVEVKQPYLINMVAEAAMLADSFLFEDAIAIIYDIEQRLGE